MTRIEKLSKFLPEDSAALVLTPVNRFYLTGFPSSAGVLLVFGGRPDKAVFFTDGRYIEAAKLAVNDCDVQLSDSSLARIKQLLADEGSVNVWLETGITVAELSRFVQGIDRFSVSAPDGLTEFLTQTRAVKEPAELVKIKEAQAVAQAAFHHIADYIRPGVLECEIALELEMFMRKNGAQASAFDIIALAGGNTSKPHGVPGETAVHPGDLVLLDYGAVCGGYRSDMTRTVAMTHCGECEREVYELVKSAGEAAILAVRAGICASEIDKTAREVISAGGYGKEFSHSTGHGVGLDIHEAHTLSAASTAVLAAGNVQTVEPGIYIEGAFGVRIEDMVVVTEEGCENLTSITRDLVVL
ncbi:MAG: Xaa-Pro peptidase family protein [Oscillospiraceae bacterium]|jgi:Xaa-Pro aminopeptidase|nr:Xaa-Pro peptidase family protein [Oscillospiraceae bacterium]